MSVFVKNDEYSDVKFYVKSDGPSVDVCNEKDYNDHPVPVKNLYEECHVSLRPLAWGESCDLQTNSTSVDMNIGRKIFDPDQYIKNKLRAVIAKWSFSTMNADGVETPVAVSDASIDQLHQKVADFLLGEYARCFEMSDDDRKNS